MYNSIPDGPPSLDELAAKMLSTAREAALKDGKPGIDEMIELMDQLAFQIESTTRIAFEVYGQDTVHDSVGRKLVTIESLKKFLELVKLKEHSVKRVLRHEEER